MDEHIPYNSVYVFYRLHLKFLEEADRIAGYVPCILRKTARDGSPSDNLPPGLTVSYFLVLSNSCKAVQALD